MSSVLLGEESAHKDAVILNAGTALYIGEVAQTLEEGIKLAKQSIQEGKALLKLQTLKIDTSEKKDLYKQIAPQEKYMSDSDIIENLKERNKTVNRLVGM